MARAVDTLPLRPVLTLPEATGRQAVAVAAAAGVKQLAQRHDFRPHKNLKLSPDEATRKLRGAAGSDRYTADLWAALVSDAAVRSKKAEVEPTPLCLMFGQGHQHFLQRLSAVPRQGHPDRGPGQPTYSVSETDCLSEALFTPWARPDATPLRAPRHRSHRLKDEGDDTARREPPRGCRLGRADRGPDAATCCSGRGALGGARRQPARRRLLHLLLADMARADQPRGNPQPARASGAG